LHRPWHDNPRLGHLLDAGQTSLVLKQMRWDIDNGKAWATIMGCLQIDLKSRYESAGPKIAHHLIALLVTKYSSEFDVDQIADFKEATLLACPPHERIETFCARLEYIHCHVFHNFYC
jgi:hypothetical protein